MAAAMLRAADEPGVEDADWVKGAVVGTRGVGVRVMVQLELYLPIGGCDGFTVWRLQMRITLAGPCSGRPARAVPSTVAALKDSDWGEAIA